MSVVRAFLSNGRQGVNFGAGVWRHPSFALHGASDFLIIGHDQPDDNCRELALVPPFVVSITE